jgi:hypothetical protein
VFQEVWFVQPTVTEDVNLAQVIRIWPAHSFFAVTVVNGRLVVRGLQPGESWNRDQLEWKADHEIVFSGERVGTREALQRLIAATPDRVAPREIWIHESLEADAQHAWEQP